MSVTTHPLHTNGFRQRRPTNLEDPNEDFTTECMPLEHSEKEVTRTSLTCTRLFVSTVTSSCALAQTYESVSGFVAKYYYGANLYAHCHPASTLIGVASAVVGTLVLSNASRDQNQITLANKISRIITGTSFLALGGVTAALICECALYS